MVKTLGYYLFAFIYSLCRLIPRKKNRVLGIMTHDDGEGSNVSLVVKALKEAGDYTFSYITKHDTMDVKGFADLGKVISFFLRKPYEMARAEIILLDNIFLPFAYLRRRKGVKVVQLWHGTGTIKKFGQDVNTGKLKELEQRANNNVTHLIVNSEEMKKQYAGAFGIDEQRIFSVGLPKTDELLHRIRLTLDTGINKDKEYIFQKFNIPKNKKLILYAPTFRDDELNCPACINYMNDIIQKLPKEYHLGFRLHPFIAETFDQQVTGESVCNLSYESDVNALLLAADLLITDYSSIVFEYCLLERPMIFFAYDYNEFSDYGRGFYKNYEDYVPGPIAYTSDEVVDIIKNKRYSMDRLHHFKEENYQYLDGKATERLIELLR